MTDQAKPIDHATAIDVGRWYDCFIRNDIAGVEARLAPDVLRIGPRTRDANYKQKGRNEYIAYIRDLLATMPRLAESVTHAIVPSPDGRTVFLHITERDSYEPHSSEKVIDVTCILMCTLNDEAKVQTIDIYWKEPELDYEWSGTAE